MVAIEFPEGTSFKAWQWLTMDILATVAHRSDEYGNFPTMAHLTSVINNEGGIPCPHTRSCIYFTLYLVLYSSCLPSLTQPYPDSAIEQVLQIDSSTRSKTVCESSVGFVVTRPAQGVIASTVVMRLILIS